MIEKENVDVLDTQTEELATANAEPQEAASPNTSAVLGKFKDVDALAKAYESLQAEFTRRSQKLRALEKEAENFKSLVEASGAEKLRKTAKSRREEAKKFDEFVAEVSCPAAKEKPEALEEGTAQGAEEGNFAQGEEVARGEYPSKEASAEPRERYEGGASFAEKSESKPLAKEELYRQASLDEEVRLRIVGEYLSSIGKAGAPLTSGGAGVAVTPPTRAKTVGQAGNMALLYFRKPTID